MSDVHALYLQDVGTLVDKYAHEAKEQLLKVRGTDDEGFAQGYLMAFHRLVTLMQQQAIAFDIPLNDIGLSKITEEFFFE